MRLRADGIYRVQDRDGRGPWRPGFSALWHADTTPMTGRPITSEPGISVVIAEAHKNGLHIGCAVRGHNMHLWFTENDLARLETFGFRIADASGCDVLLETEQQVLIGFKKPLRALPAPPEAK